MERVDAHLLEHELRDTRAVDKKLLDTLRARFVHADRGKKGFLTRSDVIQMAQGDAGDEASSDGGGGPHSAALT